MEIAIIAALSNNRVIGKDGKIPWHIPEDIKRFKKLTEGNPVIMGRKTWESIPERFRPLRERTNIVLTSRDLGRDDIISCDSLNDAIEVSRDYGNHVYIMGGEQVYREAMKLADRMELTEVHGNYEGDSYFPEFETNNWVASNRTAKTGYDFVTYLRRR
jgi:dihydrofolate reductase